MLNRTVLVSLATLALLACGAGPMDSPGGRGNSGGSADGGSGNSVGSVGGGSGSSAGSMGGGSGSASGSSSGTASAGSGGFGDDAGMACPDRGTPGRWQTIAAGPFTLPLMSQTNYPQPRGYLNGSTLLVFANNAANEVALYDLCADRWAAVAGGPPVPVGSSGLEGFLGGTFFAFLGQSGARLDLATRQWRSMNWIGGPARPFEAWYVGDRIVTFDGAMSTPYDTHADYASGGRRYDPSVDRWFSTTATPELSSLQKPIHALADGRLIVWAGQGWGGGAVYDFAADAWRTISPFGEPNPGGNYRFPVWTGKELMVLGGYSNSQSGSDLVVWNGLGIYDPANDRWRPMNTHGIPDLSSRGGIAAVWTGSKFFLYGDTPDLHPTGALYDPASDSWSTVPWNQNADSYLEAHATPTGKLMMFPPGKPQDGWILDPEAKSWTPIDRAGAPTRTSLVTVWTGTSLISWGQVVQLPSPPPPPSPLPVDVPDLFQYFLEAAVYRIP